MNDLLERYLYDVGRRLPARQRDDILKELRSALLDMLEERGEQPTAQNMATVLREYGRPADVAAQYTGERSLVGPELLPIYWFVLKIALGAMALAVGISAILSFGTLQPTIGGFAQLFASLISEILSGVLTTVGSVTVIFAILERASQRRNGRLPRQDWNPSELPPLPTRRDEQRTSHNVVAIVFCVIALVVFNQYPEALAIYHTGSGGLQNYPLLSQDALAAYLPLWNVGWVATIVLCAVRLAYQKPSAATRLADLVLQAYGACVLVFMLVGPGLLGEKLASVMQQVSDGSSFMNMFLTQQFRWAIALAMALTLWGIVRGIVRLVRRQA